MTATETLVVHVRKRLPRGGWSTDSSGQFRRSLSYTPPPVQTLCGAPATTVDVGWGDVRGEKSAQYVGCDECRRLRLAALS